MDTPAETQAPLAATSKYLAINDLETKAPWVRIYKFICMAFSLFALIGIIVSAISIFTISYDSIYYICQVCISLCQFVIFYLQFNAIQKVDFELQKKVVQLSVLNVIAFPALEAIAGIILTTFFAGVFTGIFAFVVAVVFLYVNIQVKKVFEGKKTFGFEKEDLGTYTNTA